MPTILVAGHAVYGTTVVDHILASETASKAHIRVVVYDKLGADPVIFPFNEDRSLAGDLVKRGVEVVGGKGNDRQTMLRLLRDVDVLLLATSRGLSTAHSLQEMEDGCHLLVEMAKETGTLHSVALGGAVLTRGLFCRSVAHCVQSLAWIDHPSFQGSHAPYTQCMKRIENFIRTSGLGWTMLRVTSFLEHTTEAARRRNNSLGVRTAVYGKTRLPYISAEDFGKVAAKVLVGPEKYRDNILNLVTMEFNVDDYRDVYERVEGVEGQRLRRNWVPRWYARRKYSPEGRLIIEVYLPSMAVEVAH